MPTPDFLNKSAVLRIHARQIEKFGGTPGIRDEGLLESALAQPQATFGGEFLHAAIHDRAAAYLYHLAMNHPFIDGNKPQAFAAMDAFLRLNGDLMALTDEQACTLMMQVAQNQINESELTSDLQGAIRYCNT